MRLTAFLLAMLLFAAPSWARLSQEERMVYREAFALAQDGRLEEARRTAAYATEPLLQKTLRWLAYQDTASEAGFAEISQFVRANPDWPAQTALRRRAEETMPAALSDVDVVAWFTRYEPVTGAGAYRYLRALLARGETKRAAEVAKRAWREENFSRADERPFYALAKRFITPEDHKHRWERLTSARLADPAMRQAERMGRGYTALTRARLLLARQGSGVDKAIRQVPASLANDPGLLYERARWRLRKNRLDSALEILRPGPKQVVNAARWWRLQRWAARWSLREGRITTAYYVASGHSLSPEGRELVSYAEAEFLAGWLALRFLEEPDDALKHFNRLERAVGSPISKARASFWIGEAQVAKGRQDLAQEAYRAAAEHAFTFYGQMAAARLGIRPTLPAAAEEGVVSEGLQTSESVAAVRLLAEVEGRAFIPTFFARLRADAESAADYRFVAELAGELGLHDEEVRTAKRAMRDGHLLVDSLYTLPSFDGFIDTRSLEPALVLGLMRQESTFDPAAVSPAGARGIMQLMPATAKQMARKKGVAYERRRLTEDATYNAFLGQHYLADRIDEFGGSYPLALAAYNAGAHRVRTWLRQFGDPRRPDVEIIDWVESIPFNETRNYVQRVLEATAVYRLLLEPDADPLPIRP